MTTPFSTWATTAATGSLPRTYAERANDVVNVKEFYPANAGSVHDGSSRPLSGYFATLAAAQVIYPFATALTQEVDYCACKRAANIAFGGDTVLLTAYKLVSQAGTTLTLIDTSQNWIPNQYVGFTCFRKFTSNGFVTSVQILSNTATQLTFAAPMPFGAITAVNEYAIGDGEHGTVSGLNKQLRIPAGTYVFGNDTLLIRNLFSGCIFGDGKLATILTGNNIVLAFDGIWYSELANFSVQCLTTAGVVALDIDGNVPGQPYTTRSVQGTTLRNMLIDGGGSTYAFALCRQGGGGAQGSECMFINVHSSNAVFACYYQNGFNALANTFMGGNFQSYPKNGIYVTGGTVAVINTGFQSVNGYKQIENNGWDINVGSSGAFEGCLIYGCRTESLRFLNNDGNVNVDIRSCAQNMATSGWFANTAYGAAAVHYKAIIEGGNLWVATTEGTTSGSKPTFTTASSPITDGSVVWTYTPFDMIRNLLGVMDRWSLRVTAGRVNGPATVHAESFSTDTKLLYYHEVVHINASGGNRIVTMPDTTSIAASNDGWTITVKKSDTSANTVTLSGAFEGGAVSVVIPGGSRGWRTVTWAGGAWYVIGTG